MEALLIIVVLSYLLGSIPSSLWAGKVYKKIDLRDHGSGNLGATNTFRVLGWKAGVVVSLIDFIKGFIAAYYVSQLAFSVGGFPMVYSGWDTEILVKIFAGLCAVGGHMYPMFAGFKGGKGVMTACGMLYAIEPLSISIAFAIFLIVMFTTRYVSVASISACAAYPLFLLALRYWFGMDYIDGSLIVISSVIALFIIYKHRGNINRLMEGNENRISSFSPSKGRINEQQST